MGVEDGWLHLSQLGKDKNSTSAGKAAGKLSSSFIGTSASISVTAVLVTQIRNPGTLSGVPGLLSCELMWTEKWIKTGDCLQLVYFQNQYKQPHFQLATWKIT